MIEQGEVDQEAEEDQDPDLEDLPDLEGLPDQEVDPHQEEAVCQKETSITDVITIVGSSCHLTGLMHGSVYILDICHESFLYFKSFLYFSKFSLHYVDIANK